MINFPRPPTHEETTRRAFEIWHANGRPPGSAKDDWSAAQHELERERQHTAWTDFQDAQDPMD